MHEEGLTVVEIAEGLGMTPQMVRMYLTRKNLKGWVKEYPPHLLFFCRPIGAQGRGVILPREELIRYLELCKIGKPIENEEP